MIGSKIDKCMVLPEGLSQSLTYYVPTGLFRNCLLMYLTCEMKLDIRIIGAFGI